MMQAFFDKIKLGPYRHGMAWVALSLMLAVHVVDETLTGFLTFYNPLAQAIREKITFLPLPIFTFQVWLISLIIAVIILLLLSPFVFRGVRIMKTLSYLYGTIMIANGLLHITGSIVLWRLLPGVYSSPLLLLFAVHLVVATYKRYEWQAKT